MDAAMKTNDTKAEIRQKTAMPLMWIGMMSIVMLFAALTSAVVVSKSSKDWVEFQMPSLFLVSTIVILLSSASYWYAFRSAKRDQLDKLKNGVLITLILGLLFAVLQFMAWNQLIDAGIFFSGPTSNVSGSYLYVISGVHLAHLVGGLVSLAVVFVKSKRQVYNSKNLLGLQVSSTYWHFLDGLWVYLYVFLNFIAL